MKPILICHENAEAIEAALKACAGRATRHCFTDYTEIEGEATSAEYKLEALVPAKSKRPGAVYRTESGGKVAKAYRGQRVTTRCQLIRRPKGWYLSAVESGQLWPNEVGASRLYLTATQDCAAIAAFKARYSVIGGA